MTPPLIGAKTVRNGTLFPLAVLAMLCSCASSPHESHDHPDNVGVALRRQQFLWQRWENQEPLTVDFLSQMCQASEELWQAEAKASRHSPRLHLDAHRQRLTRIDQRVIRSSCFHDNKPWLDVLQPFLDRSTMIGTPASQ